MEKLITFTINDLAKITNHRSGEIKFGEKMLTIPINTNPIEFLKTCDGDVSVWEGPLDKYWHLLYCEQVSQTTHSVSN